MREKEEPAMVCEKCGNMKTFSRCVYGTAKIHQIETYNYDTDEYEGEESVIDDEDFDDYDDWECTECDGNVVSEEDFEMGMSGTEFIDFLALHTDKKMKWHEKELPEKKRIDTKKLNTIMNL